MRTVGVYVEGAAAHYDKLYSYTVPGHLPDGERVERGSRVLVPFGGGNRRRQGFVLELDPPPAPVSAGKKPPVLKPILAVLDKAPLLTEELCDLALWLRERTFCGVFEAARTMLPTGLYMRVTVVYRAVGHVYAAQAETLSLEERRVFELVAEAADGLEQKKLLDRLGVTAEPPSVARLMALGVLERADLAAQSAKDAVTRLVRPLVMPEELAEGVKLTPRQQAVMTLLWEAGGASLKEIQYFASATPAVVTALAKKGLAAYYEREALRAPAQRAAYAREDTAAPPEEVALSPEQQTAYDGLREAVAAGQAHAALLFGVTGSGKTQVYMRLINRVLEQGRQVLVLVPEIALTPQVLALFLERFGARVAVLHSGLSIGERMDEWKRVRRGDATIVVGTRSAVFAPFEKLGLIVMDEEQEHTYQSEASPRYHARDAARFRCARQGAVLLLCSATPRVESYHAALSGRYALYTLPGRYGEAALPGVEIADRRGELREDSIGGALEQRLTECLDAGRQAILLLNRRGYHTSVGCRACGHTFTCPHCSVALTYHRVNHQLMCHYCGYSRPMARRCPQCGGEHIRYAGMGTQRVEEELAAKFPAARVLRMDADTTMSRYAYEQRFGEFAKGKYDVMVGTQMVAKGLDFPKVGLVGVLNADGSLYGGEFRSYENTFALLTQVIGRAGRREEQGLAVIQTYVPEHYVIQLAARQDYRAFYDVEIEARRAMRYPPYTDLCVFALSGPEEEAVRLAAGRLLARLRELLTGGGAFAGLPAVVLDPVPGTVARLAGRYRYRVIMKSVNNAGLRALLRDILRWFPTHKENAHVGVYVEMNPAYVG